MKQQKLFVSLCLLASIILTACGPSQTELDAQATEITAHIFATQTAKAPTPTMVHTPVPTHTSTPTRTPTPLPTSTHTPTSTPQPTNTPRPTRTPTPTHTPRPSPTPTSDLKTLLPTAGPLCEAAFSSPLSAGSPVTPVFYLMNKVYTKDGWENIVVLPYGTRSASQVQTLVCIRQGREKRGTYTDGKKGYRYKWTVRLVSWPEGTVLGQETFRGSDPPTFKTHSKDAYGRSPRAAFLEWLLPLLGDNEIIYVTDAAAVLSLAFSPDAKTLAIGCDTPVKLWDRVTGQQKSTLGGHLNSVPGITFSPDGTKLATGSIDGKIILWDVATEQKLRAPFRRMARPWPRGERTKQ